jgi:hypothetical protein
MKRQSKNYRVETDIYRDGRKFKKIGGNSLWERT